MKAGRLTARILTSGVAAAAASAAAALACSHHENGHAARPINAITHIYDGGPPPAHDGANGRNTALGLAIHTGACIFWAMFYEPLFGRRSRPVAIGGAAAVAATAYFVDYYVVHRRFRPGIEEYLSDRSLFAVYAALAAGYAAAAILRRRRRRAGRRTAVPA
ncbi:MAG TPA: hypothetical protein VFK84_03515 [Burkholderiales bacterium]|nr:hypothetical protein [Burkholderiales bacterium]